MDKKPSAEELIELLEHTQKAFIKDLTDECPGQILGGDANIKTDDGKLISNMTLHCVTELTSRTYDYVSDCCKFYFDKLREGYGNVGVELNYNLTILHNPAPTVDLGNLGNRR